MNNTHKNKVLDLLVELSLCQNLEEANKWYKSSQLQSCGNKTAEELVASKQYELVINVIKRLAEGGYI